MEPMAGRSQRIKPQVCRGGGSIMIHDPIQHGAGGKEDRAQGEEKRKPGLSTVKEKACAIVEGQNHEDHGKRAGHSNPE